MLKNIKLGVKMIGGFISVAIIVLIVGLFGWIGASQLRGHINIIGDECLPAIENLKTVQVEANAMRTAVRTMLNPRLSKEEKARQYDNIDALRERYEKAWDEYEKLPRTDEEDKLWQELQIAWEDWRNVNQRIIAMAREIDDTDILNPAALDEHIMGFITDHHILLESTLSLLFTRESFDGGDDARLCRFGQWMNGFETTNSTLKALLTEVENPHNEFHASVGIIKTLINQGQINQAFAVYNNRMKPNAEKVITILEECETETERITGLYDEMNRLALGEATELQNKAIGILNQLILLKTEISKESLEQAHIAGVSVRRLVFVGILAGVVVALALGISLTQAITQPIRKGVNFAKMIAQGQLDIDLDVRQKDEIGVLADALRQMLVALQYKAEIIEKIADGDLTVDIQKASDKDGLGQSLLVMKQSLTDILSQVTTATEQVTMGSDQVSQASQALSQGATEQASSLEEISSSINEINSQSKQNSENATEANALSKQVAVSAESGNAEMKKLMQAMSAINASSDEIKKVVKVIDDIAFQINLLALNANVEAARAGKYGKGFAVVAEEVRNLAVKSADAVKETTVMVDESLRNIEEGNSSVETTAKQLTEIVSGISKVADFLDEIAIASKEQAQGIDQITEGLDQIEQVTQGNTASAEESASASEELAGQAQELKGLVARFRLKRNDRTLLTGPKDNMDYSTEESYEGYGSIAMGHDRVSKPTRRYARTGSEETGIKAVNPSEVIRLNDEDFDRF